MHRFKAFRRVVRQKMALVMAPVALAGAVVGMGAVVPSPAQAYAVSTGCASFAAEHGDSMVLNRLGQKYVSGHLLNTIQVSSGSQSCTIELSSTHHRMLTVRWANRVKVVPKPVTRPAPAPTPAPAPPPVNPGPGGSSVAAMIEQVFGGYASSALAIARCESGLNPNAYNPVSIDGSHAEGVFQILYPSTWDSTPEAGSSPYNALANIEAAHAIFVRDGYNWHEWSC
jgi:hypothetical protein